MNKRKSSLHSPKKRGKGTYLVRRGKYLQVRNKQEPRYNAKQRA